VRSVWCRTAATVAATTVVAGTCAAGAAILVGTPAAAEVTVSPDSATQGETTALSFLVANDRDRAGVVKVRVSFPTDPGFTTAHVRSRPGWTSDVLTGKVAKPNDPCACLLSPVVTSITWQAKPGTRIEPGEFDTFEVLVGPLPKQDRLDFPAVQTYDDGRTASWTTPAKARDAAAGRHPAPTVWLRAEPAGDSEARGGSPELVASVQSQPAADRGYVDHTARRLGAAGLAVGLVGLAGAAYLVRRRSRQPAG
jgi:periplasmic copper chaperone A